MSQPSRADSGHTLRDRKRERTRQAIVDAATDLFERHGYDQTTVADIAAAADIGTRTFFSYFASKEEVLFPENDRRVRAAMDAIATRRSDEGPADVLLRALRDVGDTEMDMVSRLAALRIRLIQTVPTVRGRALQIQLEAQRDIARHLHAAFPDELDEVSAAALVGAFIGAVAGALQVLFDEPDAIPDDPALLRARMEQLGTRMRQATDLALRPWLR
jgi:AcrR family transcriptional regulator